jgi:hypothetical protein
MTQLLYRFPQYGYHLFKTHQALVQRYFQVLCGENDFTQFYSFLRRKALSSMLLYGLRRRSMDYHKVVVES